jgi:hypothetical protein
MKRRRNIEKICSTTPNGELTRNLHVKRSVETAWERAVRWAQNNPKYANA